jgi:hypothetical protein
VDIWTLTFTVYIVTLSVAKHVRSWMVRRLVNNDWKCGLKWLWPILGSILAFAWKDWENYKWTWSSYSVSHQDLNQSPPECKPDMLWLKPIFSVGCNNNFQLLLDVLYLWSA